MPPPGVMRPTEAQERSARQCTTTTKPPRQSTATMGLLLSAAIERVFARPNFAIHLLFLAKEHVPCWVATEPSLARIPSSHRSTRSSRTRSMPTIFAVDSIRHSVIENALLDLSPALSCTRERSRGDSLRGQPVHHAASDVGAFEFAPRSCPP